MDDKQVQAEVCLQHLEDGGTWLTNNVLVLQRMPKEDRLRFKEQLLETAYDLLSIVMKA